ncbi:MAG: STAS domain-containing protein [Melioribacteraceae bacterium]|nr:STAS domain-containing protein [Melioribacteraceae bacterium]
MSFVEEKFGDIVVEIVQLERATSNDANELKAILDKRLDEGNNNFIIDLSVCEFIDSTFLGILVHGLKRVAKQDGDLKLVGFKPAVRSMFELTRMFRVFETFNDLKMAVRSF